jgi:hypothetical protein
MSHNFKFVWHRFVSADESSLLKSHCFVSKEFPHPYTDLEKVEGNISLCGKITATEGNEPTERVKISEIEPQEITINGSCKTCMKIWISKKGISELDQ